ncbi:hypothetical protein SteCoe_13407 [Stentor coeruleus]|uniref:Uncharacterized protein n=1 Tax=Stentor coeruleus TaxID=5963 RepID=A0A1R2C8J8_9CILI|nr:hypothetical protein SteCoe_13407 [Stentor coeruleus]
MERRLLEYSLLKEDDLIIKLHDLLNRVLTVKSKYNIKRKLTRYSTSKGSFCLYGRHTSPLQLSLNFTKRNSVESSHNTRPNSLRCTPKAKTNPFNIEQTLTLRNIFNKLVDDYNNTAWVKNLKGSNNCEISVVLLKQYLLDCWVYDARLFSLLQSPVRSQSWLNSDTFIKCHEEIHIGSSWTIFQNRKIKNSERDNMMKQKLLFFFCVVAYDENEELDREGLKRALNMVEKQSNMHLEMYADLYLSKLRETRPRDVSKITFKEYFGIITSK